MVIVRHDDVRLAGYGAFENPVIVRVGRDNTQHSARGDNMRDLGQPEIILPREVETQYPGHLPNDGGRDDESYKPWHPAFHKAEFRLFGCTKAAI